MLEVKCLSKIYPSRVGLIDASFIAEEGDILALIGPNGSGKSTLLKILCDVHKQDKGTCLLNNDPVIEYKESLGYLPEVPYLLPSLTAYQFLRFIAGMKKINSFAQAEELLKLFEAEKYAMEKLSNLSQGQGKRIALIAALMGNPALLILDEPTNGLDTMTLVQLKSILRKRAKEKKITILSSHVLDFVENIATTAVFIKDGKTLQQNFNISDLERQYISLFMQSENP